MDGAAGRNAEMFAGGSVPEERLNDIVHRILHAMFASGLFDNPVNASSGPASTAEHVAVAKQAAAAGTVLLTNSQGLLPFKADAIRQIAVIGPAAHDAIYVIGGSGGMTVDPMRCSTPLRGIADRAGAAITVVHAQGSLGDVRLPVVPGAAFAAPGVLAEYFMGGAAGVPAVTRRESGIDCSGPPDAIDGEWSARWTGQLVPRLGGTHRLSLTFAGKAVLSLNGQELVRGAREAVRLLEGPELPLQAVVSLEAGVPVELRAEYETGPALHAPELGLTPSIELGWQEPGEMIDEAVGLAASSDVAVVLVQQASGEGMDRSSLHLPGDQDELVHAIALANPNTVVVLNTPGPALLPWLQEVAAVVQVWYPGQQFGTALAGVLFGDEDPGGRLPVTFPAAAEQGPPHRLIATPGAGNTVRYDEDLLVGYGFFDSRDQEPLFAFGHGLSYGTYAYSDLAVQCEDAGRTVRIAATITNQSLRAGTEVVQLYVGWPPVAGQPPRQLRGIAKVVLAPGQQTVASCEMAIEDLATYWPRNASWIVHDGRYEVTVGRSSRDLRLRGSFSVAGGLLADG